MQKIVDLSKTYTYKAFGFTIKSEFEIPELEERECKTADVEIRYGSNPERLEDFRQEGVLYQAREKDFLFRLDSVGSFRVEEGKKITVEKQDSATEEELRLFLLGSAMGALIHQRQLLPMHGSTIVSEGRAYVICGPSGAGKSTLAAVLQKGGYQVLSDDITAIEILNGTALAHPGIPHLKLWEDVLKKMEEDPVEFKRVRPALNKYRKPVSHYKTGKPVEIKKIILLQTVNRDVFNFNEISGAEKFNIIRNNTFRPHFISALKTTENHFKLASQLASQIQLITLERPNSPLLIEELADYFIKEIL